MVRKILLSLIAVLGLCVYGFAQNRQVSGKVADAEGKPVAGATVMVDGTSTGTTTGTDGKFTIAAPADATLAVSFIGYETRKVAVAGKTHVEVVMHEDAQAIENVVVAAFGTTTKKDLTGSIATIRGEELAKRQVSTVSKMLEGAVPGVQLTTATNQPGTDAAIYVRGVGSLNAGTGALIVLDGSPYQGSLSDINPADIESISVSKDATANSLYGSRAANGVVFITTKRGSLDNPIITDPGEYLEAQWRTMRDTKWASSPEEGGGDLAAAALYASQEVLGAHGNYNPYKYSSTYLIDPATGKLDPSAPAGRTLQDRIPQRNERFGQRREREVRLFHLAGLPQGRILCDRIGFRALQRPCERQHQAPQVDQGGRQPLLCPHGAEQHSGGQQPRFVGVRHGAFVGAGFSGLRPRCRGENQV